MIYEVYLNDNLLYYPNDDTYVIFNAKLETALNEAGSIEFDIPESNLRYTDFDNGAQLRSGIIKVLKDGAEIFCGEVREVTQNFDFTRTVYAVGELAYLFDSIQPQAVYQGTVTAMFTSLLANHNSQVENRKKFTKGNVLVSDANNYIYHFTNREDTLTDIREKLCNTLDGFLKIRKVNGVKYLDLIPLTSYGKYCQQEIQFGENLLDYSQNYTAEDVATCVIPLGKRLEDNERTADAIKGLDEYLTIKGTTTDAYHINTNHDYVYIQSAVNRFGWVRVVQKWDDVTVKENLKTKAEKWLQSAQYAKMELNLSAVDLALINQDIESFEVGDTVHCWAEPYGMDTTFPVRKKTIYLNDLSKNNITLSNTETSKSYTKQASNAVNELKAEIPQTFPLMEESRKTALAMLLDETQGGYVVYEYRYVDGVATDIEAINVCNARTIAASTQRWRWSKGGFGYMYRSSAANMTETVPPWQGPLVAMTADGKINASRIVTGTLDASQITVSNLSASSITTGSMSAGRITSGTMSADRISGGTIDANNVTINNLNASKITSGSLSCSRLDGGTILGQSISGGSISGASISGGSIVSEGTGGAKVTIEQGGITSNSQINCAGLMASISVTAPQISGQTYWTVYNGGNVAGASGQITWSDSGGAHSLLVQNGLIIGMSG